MSTKSSITYKCLKGSQTRGVTLSNLIRTACHPTSESAAMHVTTLHSIEIISKSFSCGSHSTSFVFLSFQCELNHHILQNVIHQLSRTSSLRIRCLSLSSSSSFFLLRLSQISLHHPLFSFACHTYYFPTFTSLFCMPQNTVMQ
jgi:hypothetical protein